jgi:RNA polymerase sigma-70 factor (ECF subfamily)
MAIDLHEDAKLILAAQANPAAFSFIFSRYYGPIFRYCVLRTGNARDAEDLAMDVFTEALAGLARFRWNGKPLLAWLFAIARHRGASDARKRTVRTAAVAVPTPPPSNGIDEACVEARRLLGKLDAPTAEALVLRFVVGCSFEEIAALQGVDLSAAKMRVYRAVAKARRVMGADDEG